VSQKVTYETKRLDHLGIVAGICQEIGLVEVIDEQVGANGRQVSVGQATQAMILNGLGFSSRALYLTSEFFANKPVELLVGPGISAAMLNDDTLGRALDALYAIGGHGGVCSGGSGGLSPLWHPAPVCAPGQQQLSSARCL
jgi:hypothetical protein